MLKSFVPTVQAQKLCHESISLNGLHNLESQRALLGKAGVERECCSMPSKFLFRDCCLVEFENLKGTHS